MRGDDSRQSGSLFDLALFEQHVLPRNGVVFAELKLFRRGFGVLFRRVVEPRVRGTNQFDKNGIWFGHVARLSLRLHVSGKAAH